MWKVMVCWICMIPPTNNKGESVVLLHVRSPPVVYMKYNKISEHEQNITLMKLLKSLCLLLPFLFTRSHSLTVIIY